MNAVPGAALLLFAKKFSNEFRVNPHWYVIASIAVVSPFFAFIATTAFDRVAIYFMVIQIYVLVPYSYDLSKSRCICCYYYWHHSSLRASLLGLA